MPKIQLRQDLSGNWRSRNPILLIGELGIETDTNKFKIGDGETSWNSLDYITPTKTSDLTNDSGYINISAVPTLTSQLTNDSGFLTAHQDLSDKQDKLTAGRNITIDENNVISSADVSATTNYEELINKPQINGITLSSNKTSADLGIITSSDIPTKTSDLTNDSGFINISFVPTQTSQLNNDSGYLTATDLSNYAAKTYVNTGLATKQDVLTAENGGTDIEITTGGTGDDVTASGTGSVLLENAEADSLNSVTLTGGTTINIDIPSDYTRIEFLEATGTQYIDSGVVANFANNKIEQTATVQYTTSNTSRELMGTNGYGFWGKNASNKIEAALGSVTVTDNALVKNVISWTTNPDGRALTLNVNSNQYTSTASSFVDANYAYYVFALGIRVDSGASASFLCHAKVWDYTIAVDDEVVCHLIPVRRNSDNVLGMYDIVTGTFKTNAGTGTFTAGSDVVTPSPTNPVDIITNNGNITVSPNLFRTLGTTTTQGGVTYAPQADGSVICTGRATAYYSYYLGRADFDPSTIDKITVAINGTYNATGNIVVDKFHIYSGSTSLGTISYTNWTQSLTVDIANDYPTADNIRVYLKRNSNTDTNATIKPMAVKGTVNKAWKPYGQITITGTVETVTDEDGNTATAETLLAMNTYADTQELITGAVNRQLAILVLTGTEAWSGNSSNSYFSLAKSAISPTPTSNSCAPLCTHLVGANTYESVAGTIYFGTSYLNVNYNNEGGGSSSSARANFNNWLKSQYAAGTPVIVVYPLATETTETVTGQTLTTIDGNNTLTISQASIENVPISANYTQKAGMTINFTNDTGYITSSALSGYVQSSDLATVATSGDYDDLTNKPTIPTVNDATITFTQGGTTKGTITLNQSSNQTIALDAGGGSITVDQTFDGTSTNAQSGVAIAGELADYQESLVSGTNIKTINSTSLLGSGNIDTSEIFVATSSTTYTEVTNALSNYKAVFYHNSGGIYYQYTYSSGTEHQFASLITLYGGDIRVEYVTVNTSNIWYITTYTVANKDLSNLSSTGTKVLDGQWVTANTQIASNVSVNGSTDLTYTLSDVPNDGNKYEVLLTGHVYTSSSSGNAARLTVSSDIVSGVTICGTITRTSQSNIDMGGVVVPVGNRQIKVSRDTTWNGTINLYIKGYRRIGSNS